MGSVKDLNILSQPEEHALGVGSFRFSDRYSVFDWGEMPDHIEGKGKALCILSAYFFEKLEKMGLKTHYLGLIANGQVTRLSELKESIDTLQVRLVRILRPSLENGVFNYSLYQKEKGNFLIPLEVIYRNALPEGASVFKRLKEGSLTLHEMGLDKMPIPGERLQKPMLDVSTKLETIDRYLSWNEARTLANLKTGEFVALKEATLAINQLITQEVERVGLVHEDGKVEFAFDEHRNLMLVDVLGTPDECRFTFEGMPVSKEIARVYYRKTPWFTEVEEAKKKDRIRWKEKVKNRPEPLPEEFLKLISLLYQACSNEITQRIWFKTPPLKEILLGIRSFQALTI
ncbi:MAG: phosphoribosylaminoimidazolesuccinocarboxamide synthase [Chlamydiae bacterium]|nr:phosphoribosylaminoimidazolesuccinocarboxamide synthase [Chlamydiota bacterium]